MGDIATQSKTGLSRRRTDAAAELDRILSGGLISPVYQPIVQLSDGRVVAFEALARGPEGSSLEMPGPLFGAAARHGRLSELDWACRSAAIRGAFEADYLPPAALFVNVEPVAAAERVPEQYARLLASAQTGLRVVFEFTERSLTDHPQEVLFAVRHLRELGAMIALDDVGVDPRSVALLPFLEPEVVKLDMSLTQSPEADAARETFAAVQAYAEQVGAIVLAEGIEDASHLANARGLAATHGQGWLFGRPAPLPPSSSWQAIDIFTAAPRPTIDVTQTPFQWLADNDAPSGELSVNGLQAMWDRSLAHAATLGSTAVILTSAGDRPTTLAAIHGQQAAFTGVLTTGELGSARAKSVRYGTLDPAEPLSQETCVCVLAPHYAVAIAAQPTTDDRWTFVISYDRTTVSCAARRLMVRIDH